MPLRERAPKPENRAVGVSHLRRVWQGLTAVPWWGWGLVGTLALPLYVRYFGWVVGACVEFVAPMR